MGCALPIDNHNERKGLRRSTAPSSSEIITQCDRLTIRDNKLISGGSGAHGKNQTTPHPSSKQYQLNSNHTIRRAACGRAGGRSEGVRGSSECNLISSTDAAALTITDLLLLLLLLLILAVPDTARMSYASRKEHKPPSVADLSAPKRANRRVTTSSAHNRH